MDDDTSSFLRIAGIGLAGLFCMCSAARADEYQNAIAKAFPGFQIMTRSEFHAEIRKTVEGNPALIIGRFNNDEVKDFAAIIRSNATEPSQSGKAHYRGKFVVCHGLGKSGYACQELGTRAVYGNLELYLYRVGPGFACVDADGKRIKTKRDAIGTVMVPSYASSVDVYADGTYSTCSSD
jgi:hypothetical protein